MRNNSNPTLPIVARDEIEKGRRAPRPDPAESSRGGADSTAHDVRFGRFRYSASRRLLWEDDAPVRVGSRALAILSALIECPGRLVSKSALLAHAWPGLRVDDANLKAQISNLRRALKDSADSIRAESSLGYRFVADVTTAPSLGSCTLARRRDHNAVATPGRLAHRRADLIELLQGAQLVEISQAHDIDEAAPALTGASQSNGSHQAPPERPDLRSKTEITSFQSSSPRLSRLRHAAPAFDAILNIPNGLRVLLVIDNSESATDLALRSPRSDKSENGGD
jgi:DNA-binding winged helix-turn-helix (wHTH) protein